MLTAKREWRERPAPEDIVTHLQHELQLHPLVAQLLVQRGVSNAEQAQYFLQKRLKDLHPPERLRHMQQAAKRFAQAINNGENILIHGDFDVDGSTSATLLKRFCQACQHDAEAWIPHRRIDGYGLSEASLRAVEEHKATLMITVDCGIADKGWAARIEAECGCDVIITDHHLPQDDLPQCHAVVNPNHPACTYPEKGLAGVGVAWKLAWATAVELCGSSTISDRLRAFLMDSLALVAIGTVADCAPLDGENRILVHHGLKQLSQTDNPGLRALLNHTRLDQHLSASDIGWKIGPLLNASGRLGSAMRNVHLLTSTTDHEAQRFLQDIIVENDERRRLTEILTEDLFAEVDSNPVYHNRCALVFAGEGWHQGIVGIVASRLVERYGKPTAVIGLDPDTKQGKGSLRSIPTVHLGHAIQSCHDYLISGGGHASAAGLSIATEKVDDFSQAFDQFVRHGHPSGIEKPHTDFDIRASVSALDHNFFQTLEAMAPFGIHNPEPLVVLEQVRFLTKPQLFGRNGEHTRGALTDAGGSMCNFCAWKSKDFYTDLAQAGHQFTMLVRPTVNYWRGEQQRRLVYVDGYGV